MRKRWSFCCTVLLLMGLISTYLCQEAQEPTSDTNHDKELPNSDEKEDDSILSHIHFSDNYAEEDLNATIERDNNSSQVKIEDQGVSQGQCNRDNVLFFRDTVLGRLDNFTLLDDDHQPQSEPSPAKQEYQRPVCKQGEGCDIPLNCYDFITNGPRDIVPDPPRVVELTPLELQNLLGNGTYKNCCTLVMFYAPWCEYSVNFAQRFNAIGRTFLNLPVISVDLSAHDPHKFVLAYLPVIAFYHWGKVIYKFDLEDSYEEMMDQLVKMTEFEATPVDFDDEENFHPVPIEREKADRFYLRLAVGWLFVVAAVTILKSRRMADFVTRLRSRLQGPPPLVADDHDKEE